MLISDNAKTFKAGSKELSKTSVLSKLNSIWQIKGFRGDSLCKRPLGTRGGVENVNDALKNPSDELCYRLKSYVRYWWISLNNCPITYVYDDEEGVSISSHSILFNLRMQNDYFVQ